MAALAAALGLSACNPPHPHPQAALRTVSSLDCPETQGDLTRKSAAADGKSCVYATDGGDQLTLQLVSLDGKDARTALAPIEASLKAELPAVGATPPTPVPPGAPVPPPAGGPKPDKDKVDIDLPGIHIHTNGEGHANVDTVGVHVDAHDGGHDGDHANVRIGDGAGGVNVNADDGGAQIRINEPGSGVRGRYILASDTPGPHGYKVAGYEARGPEGGPIAVAVLLSKSDDHDALSHDIRDLLKRNVGG
jgi:hypothetical protein